MSCTVSPSRFSLNRSCLAHTTTPASGSTGQPKGVGISHLAVTQSLLAHDSMIPKFSRFLQLASPTFDVSMFEIFFTLFRGSTLVGAERGELLSDLPGMMNRLAVDAAELTPTVAGSLVRVRDAVPGLKLLLTIGEMLTENVVDEFGGSSDRSGILYGMYGPTEAAIHCTLQPAFRVDSPIGLIGVPLSTVSAFIVAPANPEQSDNGIDILPWGDIGELAVGGHQLADGYLNRQEQTDAVFLQTENYGRIYRTGDKARFLPDGNIECLGRIQTGQVKLRGQRVELGEIEKAALNTSGCRIAVASVIHGILVVFCLVDSGNVTQQRVMDTCKEWLPSFMLPNEIVILEELPRLPSGKIDRKMLEARYQETQSSSSDELDEPQDDVSRQVGKIAEEVLGHPLQSNISLPRQGVDSLAAIRLASQFRAEGFTVGALDILNSESLAVLKGKLHDNNRKPLPQNSSTSVLKSEELKKKVLQLPHLSGRTPLIADVLPCTPLQMSLLAETLRDSQTYCNWVEIEFEEGRRGAAIELAIRQLIRDNAIFRSGFTVVDDGSTSYACIIWSEIDANQIVNVEEFERQFQIAEPEALLRPLRVQICLTKPRPRVLLQVHHAIYDGWSIDLLLSDLALYMRGGEVVKRTQFKEVTNFYSSVWSGSIQHEYARDYWEDTLRDFQPSSLPNLSGRHIQHQPLRSARYSIPTSRFSISERLQAEEHPQIVFQAALAYLLRLYTGNTDVVYGVVTSGRTLPIAGIEGIIGPCIATMPLRVGITDTAPVRSILRDIHLANREMLEHCTLSLQEIRRSLHIDPGRPLFDVLFVWQESLESGVVRSGGPRVVDSADFLEFNLVLELEPREDAIDVVIRYQESLLPARQIDLFFEQLKRLVDCFLDSLSAVIEDAMSTLPDPVMSIENPQPTGRKMRSSLASFVENKAASQGDDLALAIAGVKKDTVKVVEGLSYNDLNTRANRLAHMLVEAGVKPDDLVCIIMEKSAELYVSILAVVKAGAGYLPLTPEMPESRVNLILKEADVTLCLVTSSSPDIMTTTVERIKIINVEDSAISKRPSKNLDVPYQGSHLAYAVFTSGSTGAPKGVLVTQENLASNMEVLGEIYPVPRGSRLLQACSQAFDVSVFEIFFTWYSGMCLCAGTNDVLFRDLEAAISELEITHLSMTPTVAALVNPCNVPRVEFLVTAGEGLTELVSRRWADKGLFNGYGPSETTNICSVYPDFKPDVMRNNVGLPLRNTSAFVIAAENHGFKLMPRGGLGELCFGGEQVFRGYLKMPNLNETKILSHPQFGRVYRSGDMGRLLHDGSISIAGRLDTQVKLRGQRVELGEISSTLMRSQDIHDCVTIVIDRAQDKSRQLVGFVVLRDGADGDLAVLKPANSVRRIIKQLFQDLALSLPAYMVPTTLIALGSLPVTIQGKIDQRKLVIIFSELSTEQLDAFGRSEDDLDDEGEWTALERKVAAAVARITKVTESEVRRQTSFFSLGLDSISGISLAQTLRSDVGLRVEVSEVLRYSSTASLAARISGKQERSTAKETETNMGISEEAMKSMTSVLVEKQIKFSSIYPCTPLQEAMLSADLAEDQATYYEHTVFEVHGDVERLKGCFEQMGERHEILRTVFVSGDPRYGFVQIVLQSCDLAWETTDAHADDLDELLGQSMAETGSAVNTFHPPFSIKVFRTASSCRLLLSMHHAMYDGEAMSQLLFEIEQAYHSKLLPPPTSFGPFLTEMASTDLDRADAFWDRRLKNFEPTPIPSFRRDRCASGRGEPPITVTSQALAFSLREIEAASKSASTTLLSFTQAAWAKTLGLLFGELDICFGNVVSGRTLALEGLDRLVAPCFNTLPVRVTLTSDHSNGSLISNLQRINADSLQYQFTPLRRIQSRWSKDGRTLFDTLFILQRPARGLNNDIWTLRGDAGYMGFPIVCELTPVKEDDGLRITIHHASSIMAADDVHIFFEIFNEALKSLMGAPLAKMKEFEVPRVGRFLEDATNCVVGKENTVDVPDVISRLGSHVAIDEVAVLDLTCVKLATHEMAVFLRLDSTLAELDIEKVLADAVKALESLIPDAGTTVSIVPIDRIPLSYQNRPSRKGLYSRYAEYIKSLQPSSQNPSSESDLSDLEMAIRDVFAMYSGVPTDRISRNKTIFQLGLDSINAIQIAKALRDKKFKVSAQSVLENPSIARLARYLCEARDEEFSSRGQIDFVAFERKHISEIGLQADRIEAIRPCTPLQSGMIAQFLHTEGEAYLNHVQLQLDPDVNLARLRTAWQAVHDSHQILRIGFVPLEGEFPFAMVSYKLNAVELPWHELEPSADPRGQLRAVRTALSKELRKSFTQPPWRLTLAKGNDECVLQFSAHHALYDAESLQMTFNDVRSTYSNGKSVQGRDSFDLILQTILQSSKDQSGEHKDYWTSKLRGTCLNKFPNLTPLRVTERVVRTASRPCSIQRSDLDAACREAGVTLQAALQAVWARMLAAYTGESEVSFGIVLSGREVDGAADVVFPCTTTVPFACVVGNSNPGLLGDAMAFNSAVRKHQYSPLTDIQHWVGSASDALFDTLFVFQRSAEREKGVCLWTPLDDNSTVEYPVSLEVRPAEDGSLTFQVVFWDDVLPAEQAELLLMQFDATLLDVLTICKNEEVYQAELISSLPPKEAEIQSDVTSLHGFVEAGALLHPDKPALEFAPSLAAGVERQFWTYAQLDAEGNKYANALVDRGIKPASLVAICFDKCPQASFATLGILKAGCAFVALDHSAPASRKAFILEDSKAAMVLTTRDLLAAFQDETKVPIVCVEDLEALDFRIYRPSVADVEPEFTSYSLYTSGSTGTPKGCNLSHENAVQFVLAFQRLFAGHWRDDSRMLQFASFHFDVSVMEQFFSWSIGICVVSAPRDVLFEDLPGALHQLGITHIDLTPSLARLITPDDVPSLCQGAFITGGEQLKQEILDAWGPKCVIYNGYGPTECTIGCTMYQRVPQNGKPSNIGWQYDNAGSYVFRPGTTELVLRGAPGELCISGKLVGQGYLGREDLTAERFPYLERYGERVYRTGDLVRMLHDGSFDFLGRIDDQVKLRGQRLELGEVNSALRESGGGVRDVASLVVKHPAKQTEQLISFVVVNEVLVESTKDKDGNVKQGQVVIDRLRGACQSRLAGYMVPSQFLLLEKIPLTANNKIDTRRLRQLYEDSAKKDSPNTDITPSSDTAGEKKIIDSISQHLSLDAATLSNDSNIFHLGLDSISVFAFIRRLKRAGFQSAQPSIVMKSRTIASLAKALAVESSSENGSIMAAKQNISACRHRYRSTAAKALGIDMAEVEAIAPCTPLQQGLIARALESDDALYYNSFTLELAEGVDVGRLRTAWERVIAAAAILRTYFVSVDEGHLQAIVRDAELRWLDRTLRDDEELSDALETWRREWAARNGELILTPFEVITVARPSTTPLLVLHLFHALYDATSLPLLLRCVMAEYAGKAAIYGPPFVEVLPYGPLRVLDGAKQFWARHLDTVPTVTLSSGSQIEHTRTVVATRTVVGLRELNAVRKDINVTHQALVQACWLAVLQDHLRAPSAIGLIVSGRSIDYQDADHTIGPLFNTIPFFLGFEENDTWASAVARCHEFNIAALPFQHTPLRDVMKWCKKSVRDPIFDSLFVFQKSVEAENEQEASDLWTQMEGTTRADYPLAFEAEQTSGDTLDLTIVAQTSAMDCEGCEGLLAKFEETMRKLLRNPQQAVKEVFADGFDSFKSRNVRLASLVESKPKTNGDHAFDWTMQASMVREQIASLAGVEANDFDQVSSLFELGLDSIDAIKLSSRLKGKGMKISVSTIMRNPTVEGIVGHMENFADPPSDFHEGKEYDAMVKALELHIRDTGMDMSCVEAILPTTPLQEGMLADMHASEFRTYFNHDVLKLRKHVNLEQLKNAWATLVEQSPILRTIFLEVDDPNLGCSFAQVVRRDSTLAWTEVEGDFEDMQGLLEGIRAEMREGPNEKTPFRLTVVHGADRILLVLSIAHALYDGWTLTLIHRDVNRAYHHEPTNRPAFEGILKTIMLGQGSEAESFWQDTVRDTAGCIFPVESNVPPKVHRRERASATSLRQIQSFAKSQKITLQALGQTCWAFVLASYTHTLDALFGVVLSGRDDEEAQQVLLPTMNTIVARCVIHGRRGEMLRYVQSKLGEAMQHQHYPLRKVQRLAGLQLQERKLFNSLFIYQKRPEAVVTQDDADHEQLYDSLGGASAVEYPVCVEMEVENDTLIWRTACEHGALDDQGTEGLLDRLDMVLEEILAKPEAPAVVFDDNGAAVCGLAPFTIQTKTEGVHEQTSEQSADEDTPWSETEKHVRETLAAVAKVSPAEVSKRQTLYHLGLDSISAIKVAALLRKRSLRISVSDMLKAGSVVEIASVIDGARPDGTTRGADPAAILRESLEGIDLTQLIANAGWTTYQVEEMMPVFAGQVYFLSAWQQSEGVLFYPTFRYHIEGVVDMERLGIAWTTIVKQHSILRTVFLATTNTDLPFVQAVLKDVESSFQVNTHKNEGDGMKPMVSLQAHQNGNRCEILLHIHHALYDAVSLPLLIRALQEAYNNNNTHTPPSSHNVYGEFLALGASKHARAQHRTFWTSYLTDMPSIAPAPDAATSTIHRHRTSIFRANALPRTQLRRLTRLQRTHGLSIQALFLAAVAQARASPDAHADVLLGTYLANRSHVSTAAISLSPTVNVVPLRAVAPAPGPLVRVAAQVQRDLQRVGSEEGAFVALCQVKAWTGCVVECVVNFLRLPGEEEERGNEGNREGIVILRDDGQDASGEDGEDGTWESSAGGNVVKEAYAVSFCPLLVFGYSTRADGLRLTLQPTIDLEAAVRDGALDVGVFAPDALLTRSAAEEFLDEVMRKLMAAVEEEMDVV